MSRRIGYKEDLSKGKMLRFEDNLPKLPVPDLKGTASARKSWTENVR